MIQKNILEQLSILFNIFMSNKNAVLVSIIAFASLILFTIFNRFNNKKITKIILISIYVILFGLIIYFYHSQLLSLIDYLIDNIFILLLFPNLAVYTLVIITANILLIKSIFSNYKSIFKFISMIFFILFNIIFYLIVDNIIKNNILVYEPLNIYTNNNLLVLIQVSMYLFICYLLIILISNISKYIIKPAKVKEVVVKPAVVEQPVVEILPTISDIPEITPNTLVIKDNEINNIRSVNVYNEYIDIEPIKKKKVEITSLSNMDKLFGKSTNTLSSIITDINVLKGNVDNQEQIKKIYDNISLNSKDLSLNDYNYLLKTLREIKNHN